MRWYMNCNFLSQVLGVSRSAISQAVKSGKIELLDDGDVNFSSDRTIAYLKTKNIDKAGILKKASEIQNQPEKEIDRQLKKERLEVLRLKNQKLENEIDKIKQGLISYAFVESSIEFYLDSLLHYGGADSDLVSNLIKQVHANFDNYPEDEARFLNMSLISEFVTKVIESAKNDTIQQYERISAA